VDLGQEGYKRCGPWRFHDTTVKCKRLWPQRTNTDGFFVAKFTKISNTVNEDQKGTSMLKNKHLVLKDNHWDNKNVSTSKSKKNKNNENISENS
jgi:hypothetical protein